MNRTRALIGLLLCLLLPLQGFAAPDWHDDCPMETAGGERDAGMPCCDDIGAQSPLPGCEACASCAVGASMLIAAIAVARPDPTPALLAPSGDRLVGSPRPDAVWRPPSL